MSPQNQDRESQNEGGFGVNLHPFVIDVSFSTSRTGSVVPTLLRNRTETIKCNTLDDLDRQYEELLQHALPQIQSNQTNVELDAVLPFRINFTLTSGVRINDAFQVESTYTEIIECQTKKQMWTVYEQLYKHMLSDIRTQQRKFEGIGRRQKQVA